MQEIGRACGALVSGAAGLFRTFVVPETSNSSDESGAGRDSGDATDELEDDEDVQDAVALEPPRLRFCIAQGKVNYASHADYSESVLNWTSKAYVGRRPFSSPNGPKGKSEAVKLGPYTISEITEIVQRAADDAGFSVYLHKGVPTHKPNTAKRLSLNFQCDHGRVRWGKEAHQEAEFNKVLKDVVASTAKKSRKTRKDHGYKPAPS